MYFCYKKVSEEMKYLRELGWNGKVFQRNKMDIGWQHLFDKLQFTEEVIEKQPDEIRFIFNETLQKYHDITSTTAGSNVLTCYHCSQAFTCPIDIDLVKCPHCLVVNGCIVAPLFSLLAAPTTPNRHSSEVIAPPPQRFNPPAPQYNTNAPQSAYPAFPPTYPGYDYQNSGQAGYNYNAFQNYAQPYPTQPLAYQPPPSNTSYFPPTNYPDVPNYAANYVQPGGYTNYAPPVGYTSNFPAAPTTMDYAFPPTNYQQQAYTPNLPVSGPAVVTREPALGSKIVSYSFLVDILR